MGKSTKHKLAKDRPSSGSEHQSNSSEPEFLLIGRITRPHGVNGEVLMQVITAYPERLPLLSTLYLRDHIDKSYQPYELRRVRWHKNGALLEFAGVSDREGAEALRDMPVYVHKDDAIPLEEGEYYLYQLIGIQVVTDTGQALGQLADVMETGANDVYIIKTPEGREILIPAIPDVVKKVDFEAGTMTVHLLEGLL